MIATAALVGHLFAEADFNAQAVVRRLAVYWMTAALAVAYKSAFRVQSAH